VYGDLDLVNNCFGGNGPALLDYSGIQGTKTIRASGNVFNTTDQPIQKISPNPNVADWVLMLGDNTFPNAPDVIWFATAPVDRTNQVRLYRGNRFEGSARIYSINGKIFGSNTDVPVGQRGPGTFVESDLGALKIPAP
jgi:hypothetical protein